MDSIVSISMFVCSFYFCWLDQSMSCRWGSIQFTLSIQTVKLSLHHGLHSQANRVGFTYPIQYKNKSVKPSTSKHLRFFLGYPVTRRRSRKKPKLNNPLKIREKTTHWSVGHLCCIRDKIGERQTVVKWFGLNRHRLVLSLL